MNTLRQGSQRDVVFTLLVSVMQEDTEEVVSILGEWRFHVCPTCTSLLDCLFYIYMLWYAIWYNMLLYKNKNFFLIFRQKVPLTQKSGIQTDPDLRWFYFSASRQCKSDIHLVETALQIFNFDLFFKACVIWHNPLFWCGAAAVGWGSQSAAWSER